MSDQKERWAEIFGLRHREKRKRIKERFLERFPAGHKESLREMAKKIISLSEEELLKDDFFRNLVNPTIHPRALELLIKYGIDYIPRFRRNHNNHYGLGEPRANACFSNAYLLLLAHNMKSTKKELEEDRSSGNPFVYVEGLSAGTLTLPMLHAWNSFGLVGKYKALDWTLYSTCLWIRYLGIPFTEEEYRRSADLINPKKKQSMLLLSKEDFPKAEEYIRGLLEKREEDSQKLKAA